MAKIVTLLLSFVCMLASPSVVVGDSIRGRCDVVVDCGGSHRNARRRQKPTSEERNSNIPDS